MVIGLVQSGSLGWEDLLKKGKVFPLQYSGRIPGTVQSMGSQRVGTQLSDFHFHNRHMWVKSNLSFPVSEKCMVGICLFIWTHGPLRSSNLFTTSESCE